MVLLPELAIRRVAVAGLAGLEEEERQELQRDSWIEDETALALEKELGQRESIWVPKFVEEDAESQEIEFVADLQ